MHISDFHRLSLNPGLSLLPDHMDSINARRLLVATALQESALMYRTQIKGPARGYWQFEAPVIRLLLKHNMTAASLRDACLRLDVLPDQDAIHEAIRYNDVLACALARLNYYWYPKQIPSDIVGLWQYYIDVWKPGRPHRGRWDNSFREAENYIDEFMRMK